MTQSEKNIQEPTKPTNYKKLLKDFFISQMNDTLERVKRSIKIDGEKLPIIKLPLEKVLNFDEKLFFKFRDKPRKIINEATRVIINLLKLDAEIKQIIDNKNKNQFKGIHLIPDVSNLEGFIPEIEDFSKDLNEFGYSLCKFKGRYGSIGLEKVSKMKVVEFECRSCGTSFEVEQEKENGELIWPRTCMGCDARAKSDFKPILGNSKTFTTGNFRIVDLRIDKSYLEFKCEINKNFDYFNKKIEELRLNEEIMVLGILIREIPNKHENRLIEKIEVLEVESINIKEIDERVINELKKKLESDPNYFERLIEAIFPLTYNIDLYFPIKLETCLSFISGGAWNDKRDIRDTLNSIIGGPGGTFKSSIARAFKGIVKNIDFEFQEITKEMTTAGLFGTTDRSDDSTTPKIRYGIFAKYSDGCICLTEFQKAKDKLKNALRCLEEGNYKFVQDAVDPEAPALESVIISQNFMGTTNGKYNKRKSYLKNIGWDEKNAETLLQRFDLRYTIDVPDTFTKLWIEENSQRIEEGIMLKEIGEELDIEHYSFPNKIKTLKEKISYVQYNYFHRAKECYRETNLPKEIRETISKLYRNVIKSDAENISIRAKNTLKKLLRGIGALRLNSKVTRKDFNYVRKKCMRYIIAFRNSDFIKKRDINLSEIFKIIFEREIGKEVINIEEIIKSMRSYIKRQFFSEVEEEKANKEIDEDILKSEYTLENYEFKKVLNNNENWIEEKGYKIKKGKGRGNKTEIVKKNREKGDKITQNIEVRRKRQGDLSNMLEFSEFENLDYDQKNQIINIYKASKEIFEESPGKSLKKKSLKQVISTKEGNASESFVKRVLEYFIREGLLFKKGEGFRMDKAWI